MENKQNKDINFSGFRLVGRNDSERVDTPVGPEYDSERVDTPKGPEYDNKNNMSSSCPFYSLSSSCLTRGSTKQQCRLDTPVKPEYDRKGTAYDRKEVNCHSGPRAGIQGNDNLMPKAFRIAESGRSMIEMLGTLAIIGVLSIGGIAGYSYGMDKYRANETLKDINLRVVDLLTQASQGREALSLAEWKNEDSVYDFSEPAYVEGENLIAFDVGTTKKLPKSVCQAVFDGLANTAVQIDINDVPGNSNKDCGTNNTMTFYFEGGGAGGEETPTGEQCGSTVCGICETCDSVGALSDPDYGKQICYPLVNYSNCTTDDHENGWCINGKCQPNTTTCNCGPNQYCADKNTFCVPSPSGTCKDLDFRTVEIDGTTYYISNSYMSWWDAQSACDALGNKQLLSIYELVNNFDDNIGYGCQYLTNTALGNALYEKGWSSSGYPRILSNTVYSSCSVLYVDLWSGFVSGDTFYDNDFVYAVCR